ncbi:MAG: glycoside hydrolase family 2 TIM barrel-domain containing protein [Microthrixaceae bacterium]
MSELRNLLALVVADPTVTGARRLPMRPRTAPCPDADTARLDRADTSPWWRDLDGVWDLAMYDSIAELPDDLDTVASGDWEPIEVPCAWSLQRRRDGSRVVQPQYTNVVMPFPGEPPSVPQQNPVGVHRRTVTIPRDWAGRRVVLRVGAAESALVAVVNGAVVGAGTDSRLPNEFDITEHVRAGRRATITLVVARWSAATWVEDQDQWWHGGIQRSVSLYSTDRSHLSAVELRPGLAGADTGTLDVAIDVGGDARVQPGWTVDVAVEELVARRGSAPRRLAGVDAQAVPNWDASSEAAQLLGAMFVEPGVLRLAVTVPDISPWSHESPVRYRVLVSLRSPDGDVVEVSSLRTGFRSVEVADNELRINGQPVLIHGVNLHEHDPERGRAVPESLTRQDLTLMKAHNLNAVRAAHYPHDEHLAELCDELGLYLVDEANVESHGRQHSLCHDPRYTATIIERVERMVRRDQHHPSIVVWSLGNEAGDGAAQVAAAAWVRHHDPTRPVQYEGPLMHDLYADAPATDVVCPMYAPIDTIVEWARAGRDRRRPLVLCEYSHAMGNSNGSLADHWAAFESTPGLQGGFIWEWLDHGLVRDGAGTGPGGRTSWGYGGDFGDHPNDANFICDGLVSPDRVPHPAMREVHWVGRPVTVAWDSVARRRLRISNRRWFQGLGDLVAHWSVAVDGTVVDSGELEVPEVGPRAAVVVARPCRVPSVPEGAEAHLEVRWSLRRATSWAPKGHVVGSDQLALAARTRAERRPSAGTAPTSAPAADVSWPLDGVAWSPTLFRALTDNDGLRQSWMRGFIGHVARWVDLQGLDRCEWSAEPPRRRRLDGVLAETVRGELRAPGASDPVAVRRRVRLHDDGWAHVEITTRVPSELADPPRVGTQWVLPAALDRVEWFGDGPHEAYADRRSATTVGRWSSTVDDLYTDYVLPQEHGQRTGVRWVHLRPARSGRGGAAGCLLVADPAVGGDTFDMAVRRHSDADLWASTHTDELEERSRAVPPATYLYLDVAQRGLGTGSCGPDTLEPYRIGAGTHTLAFWCRGVGSDADVAALARSKRRST